jgi:Ca2+-binding EF-hand superfamily protein
MIYSTSRNDRPQASVRGFIPTIKSLKATGLLTLAVLLAPSLAPLHAAASSKADRQKRIFQLADCNKDGKVTEKEFVMTALYGVFAGCKKYERGTVTKEAYLKAIAGCPEAKNAEAEWAMMDVEGRGYITFEDFLRNKPAVKEMQAKFRTLDKSGKGFITMADLPRLN